MGYRPFGADDGTRTRDPHLGKAICNNFAASGLMDSPTFYRAFDLPLLILTYLSWPRLVRFRGTRATDFRTTCTTETALRGELLVRQRGGTLRLVEPRANTVERSVRVDVAELPHLVLRLLDLAETSLHSRGRPFGMDRIDVGHVDVHN